MPMNGFSQLVIPDTPPPPPRKARTTAACLWLDRVLEKFVSTNSSFQYKTVFTCSYFKISSDKE